MSCRFVCTRFWIRRFRDWTFVHILWLTSFRPSWGPFSFQPLFILRYHDFLHVRVRVCAPLGPGSSSSPIPQHIRQLALGGSPRCFSSWPRDAETPAWSFRRRGLSGDPSSSFWPSSASTYALSLSLLRRDVSGSDSHLWVFFSPRSSFQVEKERKGRRKGNTSGSKPWLKRVGRNPRAEGDAPGRIFHTWRGVARLCQGGDSMSHGMDHQRVARTRPKWEERARMGKRFPCHAGAGRCERGRWRQNTRPETTGATSGATVEQQTSEHPPTK